MSVAWCGVCVCVVWCVVGGVWCVAYGVKCFGTWFEQEGEAAATPLAVEGGGVAAVRLESCSGGGLGEGGS